MIRFIIFFIQFILLLIILSLVISNPFVVSFDIFDLKYSLSSNLFVGTFLSLIVVLYFLIFIYFKSRVSLNKFVMKKKYQRIERGYNYFVDAMIYLANKDNKNASISHKKMKSFLKGDQSLSLLLESEVFKNENRTDQLSNVYEEMLKNKKTESLGYRGLMELNLNNQDYHHAFLYGEKLFLLNPNIDKLYETLIHIAAKTKNWGKLIWLSEKAYSKKIIKKEIFLENTSISYYEIAKIKLDSNIKEANKNIVKSLELRKYFVPYIKLHLEILSIMNNVTQLKKMIKKYWYYQPSSPLRKILTKIITDNNLDNLDFINQVIKNNFADEESKKMLVFFAIRNEKWKTARENIIGLIGSNPSRDICLLMADIEIGENNDKQKSDAWIMRSQNAISENLWVCKITNQSQEVWNSLSDSGYFNSLVIDKPKMLNKITN